MWDLFESGGASVRPGRTAAQAPPDHASPSRDGDLLWPSSDTPYRKQIHTATPLLPFRFPFNQLSVVVLNLLFRAMSTKCSRVYQLFYWTTGKSYVQKLSIKPSIWDTFAYAGNAGQFEGNGDIACDQYHKYKDDVKLMAKMGLDAYRFSISWSRLIPDGKGPINPKGLQYYNNLINELTSQGIQPHVTLHHWDLPQALEDEYLGWVSRRIIKDFTAYADVCFKEFGDRVKYWTTVNEGNGGAIAGYGSGFLPPQRKKYQVKQQGFIGFNLIVVGLIPLTNTREDIIATQRAQDFYIGWFMNPLTFGEYPRTMKKNVGSRLPFFTSRESNLVKGSIDFLGVNFYNTFYIKVIAIQGNNSFGISIVLS
ncbi:unnamed protein product [Vicia faba]|uniref:Uncharacterized protein n=1 Tax=Vicia faba TaxID=3906 RepID=A0AAV1BAL2_VICFA|nr:unnamed protein product [Vicia faba]